MDTFEMLEMCLKQYMERTNHIFSRIGVFFPLSPLELILNTIINKMTAFASVWFSELWWWRSFNCWGFQGENISWNNNLKAVFVLSCWTSKSFTFLPSSSSSSSSVLLCSVSVTSPLPHLTLRLARSSLALPWRDSNNSSLKSGPAAPKGHVLDLEGTAWIGFALFPACYWAYK